MKTRVCAGKNCQNRLGVGIKGDLCRVCVWTTVRVQKTVTVDVKLGPTERKVYATMKIAGGTTSEIQSTADANGIASGKDYLSTSKIRAALRRMERKGLVRKFWVMNPGQKWGSPLFSRQPIYKLPDES